MHQRRQGGAAGGVAFLVKAELEQAWLITDHRTITAEGFYGAEEFAAELTLKHKTGLEFVEMRI